LESRSDAKKFSLKWWRLLPPISCALLALSAEYLIDEKINAVGMADAVSETALWVISLIFWAWAIIELGGIVSRAFVRSWQLDPKGVNHYLTSIFIRILSIIVAIWIVIYGVEGFGISIMPLLAGLGVGGIAIALAVRPTLENLIGGIILFIDKPVEVGDLCHYSSPTGSQIGIVEKIGLRSTRLRKYEDTLITIPNAEFSQLQIENLSSREMTLLRFTLSLRYETTADQLRFVLTHLRIMLIGHPKVSPERLRVRFKGFGDSSLDVEIFAYIRTNTYPEYWAIREDINLRIIDVVNDAGTGFAFPSQTTYLTQDTGLDKEKIRRSEEKVEEWRSDHTLPFPEIEEEEQIKIEDILDYPPTGSPSYHPDRHPSAPDQYNKKDRASSHSMKTKNWKWKRRQWSIKSD
jgi:MscS family membrane protein